MKAESFFVTGKEFRHGQSRFETTRTPKLWDERTCEIFDLRNDRRACNNAAQQDLECESPPLADVLIVCPPSSIPRTRPIGREQAVENCACDVGDVECEDDIEENIDKEVEHVGLDDWARRGGGA